MMISRLLRDLETGHVDFQTDPFIALLIIIQLHSLPTTVLHDYHTRYRQRAKDLRASSTCARDTCSIRLDFVPPGRCGSGN